MPNSFDLPPVYDEITKKDGTRNIISDSYNLWLGALIDNLSSYITEYGITPPNLTQSQINSIQSPQNNQMVYNVTIDAPQFFQTSTGSWRTISFT